MKKSIVMVFIVLMVLSFVGGIAYGKTLIEKREDTYRKFGPKLIDAVVQVMLDEINAVRKEANLEVRTHDQMMDAIDTALTNIDDYDWMNEEI